MRQSTVLVGGLLATLFGGGGAAAGAPPQNLGTIALTYHLALGLKPRAFMLVSPLRRPDVPLEAVPAATRPAVARYLELEARFEGTAKRLAKLAEVAPVEAERAALRVLDAECGVALTDAEAKLSAALQHLGSEALLLLGDLRLRLAERALVDTSLEARLDVTPALAAWARVSATAEPATLRGYVRYREGTLLAQDDRVDDAIAAFRAALATDGLTSLVRGATALELGDLLWNRGDPHAIALLAEAIVLTDGGYRTVARFRRMTALRDFGRPLDAAMEGVALLAEPALDEGVRGEVAAMIPYALAETAPAGLAAVSGAPESLRTRLLADAARLLAEAGHVTWAELYFGMVPSKDAVPGPDATAVAEAVAARGGEKPEAWVRRVLRWCIDKVPEAARAGLGGLAFDATFVPPQPGKLEAGVVLAPRAFVGPLGGCLAAPVPPPEGPARGWTTSRLRAHVTIDQAP